MPNLENIRARIDEIDDQIQALYLRRMECVENIALIKKANGIPILDQEREAAILQKRRDSFPNPRIRPYYQTLIQVLLDTSKAYQESIINRR